MLYPGLVSITFRKLSPREIVDLVVEAKLAGIEWGGDVHVPHGDLAVAREVKAMTIDAGLAIPSYGSYYRAGEPEGEENPPLESVIETAAALGVETIRVWAGRGGNAGATPDKRAAVAGGLHRAGDLAAKAGLSISVEWHGNTLTDTLASAQALLLEANSPNVSLYWQPPVGMDAPTNVVELETVLPKVTHLHVFHWVKTDKGKDRCPLAEGAGVWAQYLAVVQRDGRDRYALIEFVHGDSPGQFLADAAVLRQWLTA